MEAKTKTLRIGIKNQNKRIYYTMCAGDKKLECYNNLEEKIRQKQRAVIFDRYMCEAFQWLNLFILIWVYSNLSWLKLHICKTLHFEFYLVALLYGKLVV